MARHKVLHNERDARVTLPVVQRTMPLLASYGWNVAAAYRIETQTLDHRKVRVVVADWKAQGGNYYWPVLEPHLGEDFAKITGETSLLDFCGRYGLLGYHRIYKAEMRRRNETWEGDPVNWALVNARIAAGILGAVDIINDVRSGKEKLDERTVPILQLALFKQFENMGLEKFYELRRFAGFAWSQRSGFRSRIRVPPSWENDPIGTAYHVLSWVLNQYIGGVRLEFISVGYLKAHLAELRASEPRFGPEFRWDALLQVIYWQLAESLGGAFRRCLICGALFPLTAESSSSQTCSQEHKDVLHRRNDALRSKKYRDRKKEKRQKRRKR